MATRKKKPEATETTAAPAAAPIQTAATAELEAAKAEFARLQQMTSAEQMAFAGGIIGWAGALNAANTRVTELTAIEARVSEGVATHIANMPPQPGAPVTVVVKRAGKNDTILEVPAGSTIEMVLREANVRLEQGEHLAVASEGSDTFSPASPSTVVDAATTVQVSQRVTGGR